MTKKETAKFVIQVIVSIADCFGDTDGPWGYLMYEPLD